MVAITVILAAVIATFVLGIGEDTTSDAPSATFDFEYDDETGDVTVYHTGGAVINGDRVRFAGAALEKTSFGSITEWSGGDVTSGDSATVNVKGGETLRIIWTTEDESDTAVLSKYQVPDDASGSGSITSITADASADQVSYQIGSLSKTGGSAELVVENTDTGDTNSKSVSSSESGTIGLTINDGDTVEVTLYETSAKNNKLAQTSDTAASASITNIDTGNNNNYKTRCEGEVDITATFQNVNDVYITAESETNPGEHSDGGILSSSGNTITLNISNQDKKDFDSVDNDVIVKVWETNSENNKLAEDSKTATVGPSC